MSSPARNTISDYLVCSCVPELNELDNAAEAVFLCVDIRSILRSDRALGGEAVLSRLERRKNMRWLFSSSMSK
jgi:hypothetical protein